MSFQKALDAQLRYIDSGGNLDDVLIFGADFDDPDLIKEYVKILDIASESKTRLSNENLVQRLKLEVPEDALT